MWWLWVALAVVVLIGLVVVLQRRGSTGVPGYEPKGGNTEQLGPPSGLGGDAGGGI